jgi:cytochrome c-type biogenesis protein CcmH
MGWAVAIGLALIAFAALVWLFKAPRQGWEAIGAALLIGLAGFAFQASPAQPGAPKQPAQQSDTAGKALVEARRQLASKGGSVAANRWVVIADALARNGQYADAAGVVLGAVEQEPGNADAWLALANNLTAHAEGNLTPAALYAYGRAGQADPADPGPPFFLGLALASGGKLTEGRALWADLLERSPADAPWRDDLKARLERLDAFIAAQAGGPVQ